LASEVFNQALSAQLNRSGLNCVSNAESPRTLAK
jgi:hypothetical protein